MKKALCILISPFIRIFAVLYRIVAMLLSYGLIGLALLCLIAICAELFNYGITKEAFAYLVLGIISIAVRFGLIVSVGIIEHVSACILRQRSNMMPSEHELI